MIAISISTGLDADWDLYGSVPISFVVQSILVLPEGTVFTGVDSLVERVVPDQYVKDYDSIRGEGPARWRKRFDVKNWGVLQAFRGKVAVAGAVVVWNTPGVNMLDDRDDLTVLWDLRVHPDHRGQGLGRILFDAAEQWARERGCAELKVETQNINVRACRFYARQGCRLRKFDPDGYPDFPTEVQMLWYKEL